MYPKQLFAPACFLFFALASCSVTHQLHTIPVPTAIPAPVNTPVTTDKNIPESKPAPAQKKDSVLIVKKTTPKIIEKGGKYVMIPPAYMRLKPESGVEKCETSLLEQKINVIKKYAAAHRYNNRIAFFVDMHVKSNKNRFFMVDLQTGTILKQALVAHGRGNEKFTFNHSYSNSARSNCTSLGIYKIGKGYQGAFGLSYKLYGMQKSNSNAYKRYVVLHAMGAIPDQESKYPIIQSEGCPAVAPAFLSQLAPVLDHAHKNILLYIYDSGKS